MENNIEIVKIYPLSPMQKAMLLYHLMQKENNAYFEQSSFTIKGHLDKDLLEKSFNELIKRHDVFRTVFINEIEKEPIQVVIKNCSVSIHYEDISSLKEKEKVTYLENFELEDRNNGFDFTKAPISRLAVIKMDEELYKIIWSFHHILMDGWCMGVVVDELFKIYDCLKRGTEFTFDEVYPYSDYIHWLENQDKEEASNFWSKYLTGYEQKTTLPLHVDNSKRERYILKEKNFTLDENLTWNLQEIAKSYNVTLNAVIQTIWGIVLKRYNNSNDVVFGTVVSGRPSNLAGVETMVGLFINTVPVRIKFDENDTFNGLVGDVQRAILEAKKYEYYSLADIQSKTELSNNLINHILAFENYPGYDEINKLSIKRGTGIVISDIKSYEQTSYDLNIIVVPGKELALRFSYNGNVYDDSIISMIAGHLKTIIKEIIKRPSTTVSKINILTEEERNQLLFDFNDTKVPYPSNSTLIELFEKQTVAKPDEIAVVYNGYEYTYNELNQRANKLGRYLREKGVQPNELIAIMADRSMDFIVGILGILKSGAAYMPIDPLYPTDRLNSLYEDSAVEILLIQDKYSSNVCFDGQVINLSLDSNYIGDGSNLINRNSPSDMAYLMYTSGSTGMPKGTIVEHRNVVRLVKEANYVKGHGAEHVLLAGAVMFDAITFEIWWTLLNGYTLYPVDKNILLDAKKLEELVEKWRITTSLITTSLFNQLCQQNLDIFKGFRNLLIGGDVMSPKHINSLRKKFPNINIVNCYGPTENGTISTTYKLDKENYKSVPIGKPISNSTAFIVDGSGNLQPIGAVGELWVGGDGIARGYLNQPSLTAQKFIKNPFTPRERIYKTGDLAMWMQDGNIKFLGRIDSQIKIRGFRIELEEIETHLLMYGGIKEVVATVKDDGSKKYICAYLVSDTELNLQNVKEYVKEKLPSHMVPTYFMQLDKLPLNINGKIERANLPDFSLNKQIDIEDMTLNTETERKITEIWKSVLGVDKVSINDNFFDIGGNSLLTMSMYSCIQELYPDRIDIIDIFANPTISKLSKLIENSEENFNNNEVIKHLKLPQSYFMDDEDEKGEYLTFEYRIDGERLEKLLSISNSIKVDIETILISINAFLYSRISDQEEISIQTRLDDEGEVFPLNIEFSQVSDFFQLFKEVAISLEERTKNDIYQLRDIKHLHRNYDNKVIPFVQCGTLVKNKDDLTKIYDIVIGIEKMSEHIILNCDYNKTIFCRQKIEELFNAFVDTVNSVIGKW